tara:strand:+ start:1826 stop:2152 length:327 start_codon:yes stop_codon:yes gene_type:complete
MAEEVAEEVAKKPAIMPYNKNQKRPYKNPKVQFYKTIDGKGQKINDWHTSHIAHRYWSDIDVNDQLNIIQYKFKHLPDKKRFRVIDADGNVISEVNLDEKMSVNDTKK